MNAKHGNLDVDYLMKENRKLRMELKEACSLSELHKKAVINMSQKMGDTHQVIKTLT